MMSRSALGDREVFALPCSDFGGIAVAQSHVLARFFSGVSHVIRNHGGDPDTVIEDYGIDPAAFSQPEQQISCARAMPLVEDCSFKLDSPFLGLELAACQSSDAFGYLSALCSTAPDLYSALEVFASYAPLTISPEGMFEVLESKNHLEMRWDCDSELRQLLQGNLHGAAMIMRLLQDISGEIYQPICVNLPQAPPAKFLSKLSEHFDCDVRFPSPRYGSIVLSKKSAYRPLTFSNRFAFSALERPLAALKQSIEGDMFTRVRAFIRSHMSSPACGLEECASALGTSVRTLQKHLARMDTSFSSVLEAEKQDVARAALLRSQISLDELAFQLGYAEQTTFGRAFRRWTGLAPGEYRRMARKGDFRVSLS